MKNDFRFLISDLRFSFFLLGLTLLMNCGRSSNNESTKFINYFRQGEQLYLTHCSNCHQPNGSGLGRVYPPINQSDFMQENFEQVICLIKNGIQGELLVNGKNFNQAMPGIPKLTDLEIAEIATYIYNMKDTKKGIIEIKEVARILNECQVLN